MNKTIIWIVIIVIVAAGGFAAYKVHKSQQAQQAAAMQEQQIAAQHKMSNSQKMAPSMKPSGTMMQSEAIMMAKGTGDLTDAKGMTLYTYDKDTNNTSNCTGGCLKAWSPFLVSAGAATTSLPANLGTFKRTDGSMQYTWKGMPLYYFASDTKPGDVTGDGVGGVWHVVK
jgi:predicted lipoprotein with Yx(FWY)xxD motif